MKNAASLLLAALVFISFVSFATGVRAAQPPAPVERKAIYMTMAGPLEIIRDPNGYFVLLNARPVLESRSGALTVQSYMSVGDAAQGYDAMLLRRGVGDPACPVVYDLITVGGDGVHAVALGFNNCSRLLDARVGEGNLYFVLERPDGKQEALVYEDASRTKNPKGDPVVKLRKTSPAALPNK